MQGARRVTTMKLWSSEAIAKNANVTSPAIDLRQIINNHKFACHGIVAGTGNVDISVLYCSTEDGTYIADSTLIADDQAAGSFYVAFDPVLAPFIKIKVAENNANPITSLDLWISVG